MSDPHHRKLERMYHGAACNQTLGPVLAVSRGAATVRIEARPALFHAAGAVHGAHLFKLLDDAAFFAANSLVEDVLVLTTSFTVHFLRPVTRGTLTGRGRVVRAGRSILFGEAVVEAADGTEVARGSGVFARSRVALDERTGYR